MAMYEDNENKITNTKRVEISCKNCGKFIIYYLMPKSAQIIGIPICTIKCELEYNDKQNKIKEGITEHTLK